MSPAATANPTVAPTTVLRDGGLAEIRELTTDDKDAVAEVVHGLSSEARYFRFLQALPAIPKGLMDILTDIDGIRHLAWIAECDGRPAGVVHVVLTDGDAELAVEVADRFTGRGLGRVLCDVAVSEAAARGIDWLKLYVHPQNDTAAGLFRSMGAQFRRNVDLLEGRLSTVR